MLKSNFYTILNVSAQLKTVVNLGFWIKRQDIYNWNIYIYIYTHALS